MTGQTDSRFDQIESFIHSWVGHDRLYAHHVEKVLTKAMLMDDDILNDTITHIKRSRPDLRNKVTEVFNHICGFLVDSDCEQLQRRARNAWFHVTDGPFKHSLMIRTGGILTGIELKHKERDRWTVLHADASEPGRVRATYFDERGFQGHATRDTYSEILDEVVNDGFTVEVTDVLNALSVTDSFSKGNQVASLIQQLNSGEIDWATFTEHNDRINAE